MAVLYTVGLTAIFTLSIIIASFSHAQGEGVCEDRLLNCDDYNSELCGVSQRWAATNCAKTCRVCKACPEGWTHYQKGKLCAKGFGVSEPRNQTDWFEAKKKCEALNGHLVMIRDKMMADFVLDLVGQYNQPSWIGLINVAREGFIFNYVDKSILGMYQPWSDGNPDNFEEHERCVSMYPRGQLTGQWNDLQCNKALPYVCTIPSEE